MKSWFRRRPRTRLGQPEVWPVADSPDSVDVEGNVVRVWSSGEADAESLVAGRPPLRVVAGRSAQDSAGPSPRAELLEVKIGGTVKLEPNGPRVARRGFLRALIQGVLLLLVAHGPTFAEDGSLWDEREGFRYTNRKAMQVGDLITVVVTESSSGSNRSSLSTSKEHKVNVEGGPGSGSLDFIPLFGVDSNAKNELKGSGQVSVSGTLTTTLTVEVREVRPNGYLVVEGSRLIDLNGEQEQVTLHGVVRPDDIRSDNTVVSNKLSEMRIQYAGKGAGKSASRPGILARILGWIF